MKEITVLSGKGGTGKTSITAALASVAKHAVFCDNDVDAADLHLLFNPEIQEEHVFSSGWKATIDTNLCNQCNICVDHCRFDAIHEKRSGELEINSLKCEGCRLCERVCPEQAIASVQYKNNHWYISNSRFGLFVHAQMGPGEENSGRLVTQIRKRARELAVENKLEYIINDGPPGIGCATIASLSGVNTALVVIEPTKSGLHDIKRLVELIETFKIKTYAIINKHDINPNIVRQISSFLESRNIPLLAKVPFDKEMVHALVNGKNIVEYNPSSLIVEQLKDVWLKISQDDHS